MEISRLLNTRFLQHMPIQLFAIVMGLSDFTFVCPTEIAAMNARYDEFQEMGVEILAISTDTKFSHKDL